MNKWKEEKKEEINSLYTGQLDQIIIWKQPGLYSLENEPRPKLTYYGFIRKSHPRDMKGEGKGSNQRRKANKNKILNTELATTSQETIISVPQRISKIGLSQVLCLGSILLYTERKGRDLFMTLSCPLALIGEFVLTLWALPFLPCRWHQPYLLPPSHSKSKIGGQSF